MKKVPITAYLLIVTTDGDTYRWVFGSHEECMDQLQEFANENWPYEENDEDHPKPDDQRELIDAYFEYYEYESWDVEPYTIDIRVDRLQELIFNATLGDVSHG